MRNTLALTLTAGLSLWPALTLCQTVVDTPSTFTLDAVLATLGAGAPALREAEAELSARRADIAASSLWSNPQLSASYMRSFGYTTFDPQVGVAQFGVSQLIEAAGLPGLRRRVAEGEARASEAALRGLRQGLRGEAATRFYALDAATARAALLRQSEVDAAGLVQRIEARAAAGLGSRYETDRAALYLADLRVARADAESDLVSTRAAFDALLGDDAARFRGEASAPETPDDGASEGLGDLDRLLRRALDRPELEALAARARAAGVQVDVARREVMPGPTLSANVFVGQGYGAQGERQVDWQLGLSLPLPLANDGRAAARAAMSRALSARAAYEFARAQTERAVRAAFEVMTARRAAWVGYLSVASRHEGLVGAAERAWLEGRVSLQALLEARDAVRDSRLRVLDLRREARQSEARLRTLVGAWPEARGP